MPYKSDRDKKYYHENRDRFLNKQTKQRQERKEFLLENLGHSCSVCGSTEKLEFDHINPSLKESRQSFLSMGIETIISQLDNIQVLCKECHNKKSNAQRKAAWKLFVELPLEEQERLIS